MRHLGRAPNPATVAATAVRQVDEQLDRLRTGPRHDWWMAAIDVLLDRRNRWTHNQVPAIPGGEGGS